MPRASKKRSTPASIPTLMPPAVVVPVSPVQPTPTNNVETAQIVKQSLPMVYERVSMAEYSISSDHGPLTVDDVKDMLGWETEKQWQQRMVLAKGGKPEHYLFGELGPRRDDNGQHQPVHCLDEDGNKVVCWNNANNRPFDMSWAEDIESMILNGTWAGPFTVPGETVNGETLRISRYGRVLSGQHQGTGLISADEKLQAYRSRHGREEADKKYPVWAGREHCFIETIVVTGLSEDERVLRTIDYVKPRTTADMLYTMELFRQNTAVERKEMTRMLASALDLLWARTATKGYKTHPEVVGFLERHRRLLKCVEHLFVENSVSSGRKISKLCVSAGQAAAMCYLMGCGSQKTTEYSDEYRNESPPGEKSLDWSYWDRAQDFWVCLAGSRDFIPVRTALGRLVDSSTNSDDNQGLGGRLPEKMAIIAKAWERFKDHPLSGGPPFDNNDLADDGILSLSYSDLDDRGNKLPDGQIKLLDVADFYGIDCPDSISKGAKTKSSREGAPDPPAPVGAEYERLKEETLARRSATT